MNKMKSVRMRDVHSFDHTFPAEYLYIKLVAHKIIAFQKMESYSNHISSIYEIDFLHSDTLKLKSELRLKDFLGVILSTKVRHRDVTSKIQKNHSINIRCIVNTKSWFRKDSTL